MCQALCKYWGFSSRQGRCGSCPQGVYSPIGKREQTDKERTNWVSPVKKKQPRNYVRNYRREGNIFKEGFSRKVTFKLRSKV